MPYTQGNSTSNAKWRIPLTNPQKWVTIVTLLTTTLLLRILWSYSLGNGDELFFSNGDGRLGTNVSWSRRATFLLYVWQEHNGRTIDWLSAVIYFWGSATGKWITSCLTAASATLIAVSIRRIHGVVFQDCKHPLLFTPLTVLALLFLPAFDTLSAPANFTMYSAAVVNYLVPASLLTLCISIIAANRSRFSLAFASVLGGIIGTMHEQIAIVVSIIAIVYLILGKNLQPLHTRLLVTVLPAIGTTEIFLSPGLHNRLQRAGTLATEGPSFLERISTTLFAFGVSYPFLILLISMYIIASLRIDQKKRPTAFTWAIVASCVLYVISLGAFALLTADLTRAALSMMTLAVLTTWLTCVVSLASTWQRITLLLVLGAMATFIIPAAAGLGQIRVFNYTVVFIIATAAWIGLALTARCKSSNQGVFPRSKHLMAYLACLLLLTTATTVGGLLKVSTALVTNYEHGVSGLKQQLVSCPSAFCPASDPDLPYQRMLSGYGDHGYADVDRVLEWIMSE